MWRVWLWCLTLPGCGFAAANKILDSDSGTHDSASGVPDDSGTTDSGSGTTDSRSTDSGSTDPTEEDEDGDGWEAGADCDDDDPSVHPGQDDVCNGLDDDCDGTTDEDAPPDDYEPNDSFATDLGSLEDDPEISLVATLSNVDDVDRFAFSLVDDTFDFFTMTATLSNIPSGEIWTFTLVRTRSDGGAAIGEVTSVSGDGTLTLSLEDNIGVEEGGSYELVIEAVTGVDCGRTYLLGVTQ